MNIMGSRGPSPAAQGFGMNSNNYNIGIGF